MRTRTPPGPLALVGGNELAPGNEQQDRILVEAAGDGPAFVLATAAGGERPEMAVRHAVAWFGGLGLEVVELPAVRRRDANAPEIAARARSGRFFYLVGGDPGRVPATLGGTQVWAAIVAAWWDGAALAGSSAGAMALGEWALLQGRGRTGAARTFAPALGLVPRAAVIPHFDRFGEGWVEGASADGPREDAVLVGIDERSAALWRDGVWTALGPGSVTVIAGGARARVSAGARIEGIPQPAGPPGASPDRPMP